MTGLYASRAAVRMMLYRCWRVVEQHAGHVNLALKEALAISRASTLSLELVRTEQNSEDLKGSKINTINLFE
jgi:hypothetical protein